jgi:hypothetical protein
MCYSDRHATRNLVTPNADVTERDSSCFGKTPVSPPLQLTIRGTGFLCLWPGEFDVYRGIPTEPVAERDEQAMKYGVLASQETACVG